ncbi:MAG: hypothetical protein H8E22_08165 [Candidatus Cloacimonetes bacterium]|nr:hypothetical protein [Candidatus Cloacimonadota bacterium]
MKKIFILGIFIVLFTNLLYGVTDSLNVVDSILTSHNEINLRDIRSSKGEFGVSIGRVFGAGLTLRLWFKEIGVQGSFAMLPIIPSENNKKDYSFGLSCLYDLVSFSHVRFYIIGGTTFILKSDKQNNWFLGIAPAVDFSLPFLELISFNFGYSITYPILDQGLNENFKGLRLLPELGIYIRLY